ncbi:MAG: flagellar hook-associated protein FlgL [Francisellaceae bacterium]|jgi:flagellar hook-associated protein 3 FlgL|nr:flagellar hook-associated protein FlgL [Francisellaceae bacterium]MBT6539565.1 flagellar hook-associated protein FlgL [Francisellaceae bacterium]
MANRVSTPQLHFQNLNALQLQQTKLSKTQNQISLGKKITTPSDDPIGSSKVITKKNEQAQLEQYNSNVDFGNFNLASIENQYSSVIEGMQRVREIAVQAGNITLSPEDKRTLALELDQINKQLVDFANANVDGKFLFSGAQSSSPSVTKDINGNYVYMGDESIRKTRIGSSITLDTNHTAKQIFFNIDRSDISVSGVSGRTSVTNAATALSDSGTLSVLNANEMVINGINIQAGSSDGVSTTDASGSAKALSAAINATKAKHGVVATVNTTTYDLGVPAGLGGGVTLAAGEFTLNGIAIIGAADNLNTLATTISSFSSTTGVTAELTPDTSTGPNIILTAADGRNIQLQTDGVNGGVDFANFALNNAGVAQNRVQRSTITLNDHNSISISGSNPVDVGFTTATTALTANVGTGVMSIPLVAEIRPDSVSDSERYLVKFDATGTKYSVYRESDPTVAVTDFKTYTSTQKIGDAEVPDILPDTYQAGDNIVIDGVSINITGVPAANDTFTIALTPDKKGDVFDMIRDFSDLLKVSGDDTNRVAYEVGVMINNIDSAQNNVLSLRSSIGIDMKLLETQEKYNNDSMHLITAERSRIEDLDLAEAISELMLMKTSLEAAQKTMSALSSLSLFKYL